MNETQQQVQQSVYNSGIVGSAISNNVNETKTLSQVQAQGSQGQTAAVPVEVVQPLNSDDIALPQQNSNAVDNTDYSSFFELMSSTLDAINTNIENLSSVITDVIDTLFPTKTAQSRSATNPIEKISSTNQTDSTGGLGLLGSIAAGIGGASLLSTLFGEKDKKEPLPSDVPETPPTNAEGSPPGSPETPPTNAEGSPPGSPETPVDTSTNTPPSASLETPSTTKPTATTTEKLGGAAAAAVAGKALEKVPMPNVKSPAYVQKVGSAVQPYVQKVGSAVQKIPGSGVASKGLGFIGKAASKVAPFLLPLEAYTRIDNGESPYRVGASMVGGLAVGAIGSLAGTFTAGPVGSVAGGLGGYIAGEKLAEKLFDSSDIGNKLNQESAGASENNKPEVNNITLPPQQISQSAPATPQPQTSSPSVSDVPSCDRSLPETLDCKF